MPSLLSRTDIAWIVGIALLFATVCYQFEVSFGYSALIVIMSSLGRVAHAMYARSTWR